MQGCEKEGVKPADQVSDIVTVVGKEKMTNDSKKKKKNPC